MEDLDEPHPPPKVEPDHSSTPSTEPLSQEPDTCQNEPSSDPWDALLDANFAQAVKDDLARFAWPFSE
jgi:hypothetical protein